MPKHAYSPQEALTAILDKVRSKAPALAAEIQSNIDLGQEVPEEHSRQRRQGRAEPAYEKIVPFTMDQAIQIALSTLRAHFLEQPLCIASAARDFAKAAVGTPLSPLDWRGNSRDTVQDGNDMLALTRQGEPKILVVEVQPETRLTTTGEPIAALEPLPEAQIAARRGYLEALGKLTDFTE